MAIKATHCRVKGVDDTIFDREIFKDPITDNSGKKSAKGLLQVYEENGEIKLKEQCTPEEYEQGLLEPVFLNGQLLRDQSLSEIRKLLDETLFS